MNCIDTSFSHLSVKNVISGSFIRLNRDENSEIINSQIQLIDFIKKMQPEKIFLKGHSLLKANSFELSQVPCDSRVSLTTVHLTSSLKIGESSECPLDSYGIHKEIENLSVCDAGIMPDSPRVNPQLMTMAFALRQADRLISMA